MSGVLTVTTAAEIALAAEAAATAAAIAEAAVAAEAAATAAAAIEAGATAASAVEATTAATTAAEAATAAETATAAAETASAITEVAGSAPEATGILEASAVPPPAEPLPPAGLEQVAPAGSTPPPPAEPLPPTGEVVNAAPQQPSGLEQINAPQEFSQAELDAIQQGQLDAANSGPSPYEPTASTGQTPLVQTSPTPTGPQTYAEMPGQAEGFSPFDSTGPVDAPLDVTMPNAPSEPNAFMQGLKSVGDYAAKHEFQTAGALYMGANALGMFKPQGASPPEKKTFKNPNPLSADFKGGPYSQPNVYKPTYQTYAGGGITQIGGPVEQMSRNVMGGQGNMYPQSQQEHTNFATPTQMPASAEIIRSDYDTKTSPYSGVMMASGGQVKGYANGGQIPINLSGTVNVDGQQGYGSATTPNQGGLAGMTPQTPPTPYMPMMTADMKSPGQVGYQPQQFAQGGIARFANEGEVEEETRPTRRYRGDLMGTLDKYNTMITGNRGAAPTRMPDVGINSDTDAETRYQDAYTAALTRLKKNDKRANVNVAALPTGIQAGALNLQAQKAAGGGIMQASLGSYAAGGNPRLLRGPGDGMSDNIPATIGGKQPARLADGEFVVPADVVSHLGNGSTEAGAKKLHQMMDKIRMDRTGKKKQAPAVKAGKYIPK